jgi:hypothetical protein
VSDVTAGPEILRGKTIQSIRLNPAGLASRTLDFKNVPAASKMVFLYKLQQPKESKKKVYIYLRILWGRHELKKIRIGSRTNEWISETIDLGVVAFLNRSFPVRFELLSDKAEGVQLSFSAKLYP